METVRVLYFAGLRERLGHAEAQVALPPGIATAGDLLRHLRGLDATHAAALAETLPIRCAVNQELAPPDAPVRVGDEVAFFPPITGG